MKKMNSGLRKGEWLNKEESHAFLSFFVLDSLSCEQHEAHSRATLLLLLCCYVQHSKNCEAALEAAAGVVTCIGKT